MFNLRDLTLSKSVDLLKNRKISAVELTQCYLSAMSDSGVLNCYVNTCPEKSLAAARARDERLCNGSFGSLEGIPLGIKDVFCTKGIETTACSKILRGFVPDYESSVTEKLWSQGALLLGKLNSDEFAMGSSNEFSCFGAVVNPHRAKNSTTHLAAGGSSGGAAAAVAARLCLGAIGTDTGGSVRQPASFSGVVGVKPTYGLCSRYGIIAFASSLDQAGVLARNTRDSAILLSHIIGGDDKDSTSLDITPIDYAANLNPDMSNIRIGIPKEYSVDGMNASIKSMWEKSADYLRSQGAEIIEISLPHTKYAVATYYVIALAEASSNLARYDGIRYGSNISSRKNLDSLYNENRSQFGDEVKLRLFIGTYVLSARYYDAYYIKAQKVRNLIIQDFSQAMDKVDLILAPTTSNSAFPLGSKLDDPIAMYLNDIFTIPASMAGLPALSLPMCRDSEGLPLGMQLIAPALGEQKMFNAAYALECARGEFDLPDPWWEKEQLKSE